jgi:predicted nucleic acid-binding protein
LSLTIVVDADFLSAFLKIDRLELVKDFYEVTSLRVPPAVYKEVGVTDLVSRLAASPWIQIEIPDSPNTVPDPAFRALGKGEQEAILLALRSEDVLLLMNDLKARRIAERLGVLTADVPAFLLACRDTGFVSQDQIRELVAALREKDRYGFRRETLEQLLS